MTAKYTLALLALFATVAWSQADVEDQVGKIDQNEPKIVAQMKVNGKKVREIETGPLDDGYVFFWIHATVAVAVKKIEIEGRVALPEDDPTRAAWIAERLSAGGLGPD